MSPGVEFLIVLGALTALVFLPGVLLTYWLFPGKRLDIFERIPIGFGLVGGFLVGLFLLARIREWDWVQLLAVWLTLVAILVGVKLVARCWHPRASFLQSRFAQALSHALPRAVTYDEQMASRPASRILVGLLAAALALGAFLTHLGPIDEDDWSYFQTVREFADAIRFAPASLSDRNVAHVWWLIHAAIIHAFDVDLVRLGQDWIPLLFVPISLLAFYALARVLFLNRNLAIGAVLLQFVFLFADLFHPDEGTPLPGRWLFTRIDQDHTIMLFLFLPVFATLLVWYLREGGWELLGATLVTQLGLIATHARLGVVVSILTLISVLMIELMFIRQTRAYRRMAWLGVATLVVVGALVPVLPEIFPLAAPSLSALRFIPLAYGGFPFSYYRYTFFSPTIFTLRIDFLGQPPALAAILLMPFLIPLLRKDFAARFLLATSIGLLVTLYFPPILQFLESRMNVTVFRLWNWDPKALLIAYFLPYFYLLFRDGWSAVRQRVWNARVFRAIAVLVVFVALLAIWSLYPRRDWPPLIGAGHALPNGGYEMLKALRDHTAPGEQAVVLTWFDLARPVPAYRATLVPVIFREDPQGQQGQAIYNFFDSTLVTNVQLEILNRYQATYLIVGGEREIVSQCDLLPEYFQPLYRNAYGTLYRVAPPLESNALTEANSIANYGEWEGAIEAYNAVLAEEPNNSLAHTGLGIILQLLGKPKAAVRELEAAVDAAPTNAQAHYHLVSLYRELGMNEQAAQHIQGAGRLINNGAN